MTNNYNKLLKKTDVIFFYEEEKQKVNFVSFVENGNAIKQVDIARKKAIRGVKW